MFNFSKHKWFPLIKPTLVEFRAAHMWEAYLNELEKCKDKEDVQTIQKIFKEGMMNLALDPQCEHKL